MLLYTLTNLVLSISPLDHIFHYSIWTTLFEYNFCWSNIFIKPMPKSSALMAYFHWHPSRQDIWSSTLWIGRVPESRSGNQRARSKKWIWLLVFAVFVACSPTSFVLYSTSKESWMRKRNDWFALQDNSEILNVILKKKRKQSKRHENL